MTDERLSALSLMAIEGDILQNIDFKNIISELAKAKARKVHLSANVWVIRNLQKFVRSLYNCLL